MQFFLTTISQVLRTPSGPEVMYALNLLQVARNKDRQSSFGEKFGLQLLHHHSDLSEWVLLDLIRGYEKYDEIIFMVMLKMLNRTINLQVIKPM